LSGTVATPIAVRAWSNVRTEQFKDQVREGVEHKRRLLVAGVDVHEPVDGPPGDDAIQIADRFLQARQHRQGGQPCGFLGHFERDLARHLAERTCWRAVGRKRTMAGDECSLPANPNPFERDRHTRRQLRACWKRQPPVGDTSLDAASHGHILPGPALEGSITDTEMPFGVVSISGKSVVRSRRSVPGTDAAAAAVEIGALLNCSATSRTSPRACQRVGANASCERSSRFHFH